MPFGLSSQLARAARSATAGVTTSFAAMATPLRQELGLDRLGLWQLSANRQRLLCQALVVAEDNGSTANTTLATEHAAAYLDSLRHGDAIAITDVSTDPRCQALLAGYLHPFGITAMLDVPVFVNDELWGCLRAEQRGQAQPWPETTQEWLRHAALLLGPIIQLERLQQLQRQARDSDQRYRTLFDGTGDSIFLMRGEQFVDCNPATLRMFGCTREQIIGQPPYRFSPKFQPDGRRSDEKAVEKITAAFSGQTQNFE